MLILIIIIILVFIYFIGSVLWVRRVLSASKSKPVELTACEFCGMMVNVDHAVKVQGRMFCCQDHAYHKH